MSEAAVGGDDEPTRFFAHEVTAEEIVPVPPPAPGFDQKEPLETQVPTDPSEVQFKRAGEETGASKKKKKGAAAAVPPSPPRPRKPRRQPRRKQKPEPASSARQSRRRKSLRRRGVGVEPWYKNQRTAMLAGGGAVALLAAVAAGSFMFGGGVGRCRRRSRIPDLSERAGAIPIEGLGQLAAAERALAEEARTAGAPATAVNDLVAAGEQLDRQLAGLQPLSNDPAQAGAANARASRK